jgi:hypothetical protein
MQGTEAVGSAGYSETTLIAAGVAGAILLLLLLFVWVKGRPIRRTRQGEAGDVFRASRLSSGNHLFPTQVLVTSSSLVHYTPQWIGKVEHSIHLAHIASVKIDTNLLFSNVLIETTGGTSTVRCYGHRKGDAVRMKELIERYQSEYYRKV